MNHAANRHYSDRQVTDRLQLSLLAIAATGCGLFLGWKAAVALLFGGIVVLLNGLIQRWQQSRAAHIAGNDPAKNIRFLYRCAAERFIATVVLFAAGFGLMALPPLPLLGGYVIAQAAVIYRFYQVSSLRRQHG